MLKNIKSSKILKLLFKFIHEEKYLKLIHYNKLLQNKLNVSFDKYMNYKQIEIEIFPKSKKNKPEILKYKFINTLFNPRNFFHIFFDNDNTPIRRNYLKGNENVSKIKILIDGGAKKFDNLFFGCKIIKELKIVKWYRKDITNMEYMFSECSSLINLDISKIKTDNVTNMEGMFYKCTKLKELNILNFKTDKVTNMKKMFYECSELEKLNLTNFITENVVDMTEMFNQCINLKEFDLSSFKTNNLQKMNSMFNDCSSLKSLNVSNFKTENVFDMGSLFDGCSSLKELNISNFYTPKAIYMYGMFIYCSSLEKLDISNLRTDSAININHMFQGCSSLKQIDVSNFNTKNLDLEFLFYGCSSLIDIDISNFNIKDNIDGNFFESTSILARELQKPDDPNKYAYELLGDFEMWESKIKEMFGMFGKCSEKFKKKVKEQNPDLKDEAFSDSMDKNETFENMDKIYIYKSKK